MSDSILYQGHASIRLNINGSIIYADPFAGEGYDIPADLILVTHPHADHSAVEKVPKKEDCIIFTYKEACSAGEHKSINLNGIKISAIPAYNEKHPKENGWVGFLISFGSAAIYISGDTSLTDEMKSLSKMNIDYAFLPCDGFFNMSAEEACACARLIGAKHTIPYHTCRSTEGDFDIRSAEKLNVPGSMIIRPMTEFEI